MTEMTEEMLNESQLLIQALLSEYNDDENINDGFEEMTTNISKEEREDAPVKTGLMDDFNWSTVINVEEEEVDAGQEGSYETDSPVPFFVKTIGSSVAVVGVKEAFEKEFPKKKIFADKNSARAQIQEFSKAQNIAFKTVEDVIDYNKRIITFYIIMDDHHLGDSTRGVESMYFSTSMILYL
ncbi:uncharacterized protein EV154DRAFT_524848 [Mucor mucedo]|uniref:uncharacterized protein n=1 Tax=Mucor mucedo TaxID=29922 RepID=UPI00222013D4|nr:uncharacterized protein EV154DRAFT_524848 [Mucor mucedo]KAI7878992.1 hypothetical protein EV154DRAFT_524848 [Mucor mucedo]